MRPSCRLLLLDCSRPTTWTHTPTVAIVGSGPAGLYTADELLRLENAPRKIDIFERSPLPMGLLRYGVAPDHPEVKLVSHKFQNDVLDDVRVRMIGRVEIGVDVSLAELRKSYDAVFLCHGAEQPRSLHVPAVDADSGVETHVSPIPYSGVLPGYFSSSEVVAWYNSGPQTAPMSLGLEDTTDVVVVGVGNVALDIARILLKDPGLLEHTDIVRSALQQLQKSRVRRVTLVGRRGAEHAAFTAKELRELGALPLAVSVAPSVPSPEEHPELERASRRRLQLLRQISNRGPERTDGERELCFRFLATPAAVVTRNGRAVGLKLEDGSTIEAQLVVSSIGYQMDPALSGNSTFLEHSKGRLERGLYTTGWAKRGPLGIVPNNKWDAVETVESYVDDGIEPSERSGLASLPDKALTLEQMEKIEIAERVRGQGKFISWDEMQPHAAKVKN